jgi:hypothetical protein
VRRLVAVAAAGLLLAPAAAGHGPAGGGQGYVSTVAGLQPNVLGVLVSVLGGDDRLRVANYSGKTIEVLGYQGEPFLRFGKAGVYENVRSPATYLSRERDPAKANVPASADPKAAPRWRKVAAAGESFVWHDHRIHWTRPEPPPIVQAAPNEIHRIFRWRIPARADGEDFVVSGFLGYAPTPEAEKDDGISAWLVAAVIGSTLLAAAALGAGVRRARRRTP